MRDYTQNYIRHYKNDGEMASGTGEHEQKQALWKEVGYKKGMSVLDYGCGWGAMIPAIHDKEKYLGVDIVPQAIDMAREKWEGYAFSTMEMGNLHTKKFDFIVAMSVFTHVMPQDFEKCMLDIKQAMKKSSIALIDILEGELTNDIFINSMPAEHFISECERLGLKAEFVKTITWWNGFTHSYFKLCLLPQ